VAALLLAIVALALLPLGRVELAASVSSLTILLTFIGVQLAHIVLRYRAPDKSRPFRVPLSIGKAPVLPIVGIVCCVGLLTQFDWIVYAVAIALIGLIAAAYFISARFGRGG
jgi:APA family basic amino acid/polyamine antiporter